MIAFVLRRVSQAGVVAIGVATVVFFLLRLLPGDQAHAILGTQRNPQIYAIYDKENGLTQPLPVQYVYFLANLVHGRVAFVPPALLNQNAEFSAGLFPIDADLTELVTDPLPKTLLLVVVAYALALGAAIPAGTYLAVRRRRAAARIGLATTYAVYAIPAFLMAFLLIDLLGTRLSLLPVSPASWESGDVLSQPLGLALPIITLALGDWALLTRYMRTTVVGVLVQDYVDTARAKGASESRVIRHHVLRNSLVPLISLLGLRLSGFLALDALVEYIFGYPGVGNAFLSAALDRDYYTLLGILLIAGLMSVLGSLLADLAYAWADPRIRFPVVRSR